MQQARTSRANVLLGESFVSNSKYSLHLVNVRVLKSRLTALEAAAPGSRKMKDQESSFLRELNEEVKKVNNVCTKSVLEIEESMRFLTRKLKDRVFSPEELIATEAECDTLLVEITHLEHYSTMSYDSFVSIMKKHDTIIGVASSTWFDSRLQQEYFRNIPFQTYLLNLSNLYTKIRSLQPFKHIGIETDEYVVRQYFCREEDVIKVQAWLMRQLSLSKPYLQRLDVNSPEDPGRDVTSIYLDGSNLQLYNNFLHSVEGARLVRVSWDDEDRNDCRLSFQSHTGVTDTVTMKWKYIGPFLKGEWDFKAYAEKLKRKGKIDQEAANAFIKSAEALLSVVQEKQLRSVIRVHSTRYEYENQDESVTIRMEGWIEMSKEVGDKRWAREGQATLKGREKTKLPVTVLKVASPNIELDFINELVQVGLLHPVPATGHPFEPFLFGVAKLYKQQLDGGAPSWLHSIEVLGHQHPDTAAGGPSVSQSSLSMEASSGEEESGPEDQDEIVLKPPSSLLRRSSDRILTRKESELLMSAKAKENLPKPTLQIKEEEKIEPQRPNIRIEPKTFFSNERTLLQWINAIVALATVAIALIGLGDFKSRISGYILLPVAVLFGGYSLFIFHLRLRAIIARSDSKAFQDHIGPYAIVIVFVGALLLSALLPLGLSSPTTSQQYPMIPGDLEHDPDLFQFDAPLPKELFYINRTAGVLSVLETLRSLGETWSYSLSPTHPIEEFWETESYTTSTKSDEFFSLLVDHRMNSTMEDADLTARIFSTLPKFNSMTPPTVKGPGRTRYVILVDCIQSNVFHESISYDPPSSIHTLEDVSQRIQGLDTVLNLDPTTKLLPTKTIHRLIWKLDSTLAHAVSSTIIELKFSLQPDDVILPIESKLSLRFQRKYATASAFESGRGLMFALVQQLWGGWPAECHPGGNHTLGF